MKNFISTLAVICLALTFAACSSKSDDKGSSGSGGGGQGQNPGGQQGPGPGGCRAPIVEDHTSGGCRVRLTSPAPCQTIDLTNGKTVKFEWTTDGTNCELPWKAYIGGHPVPIGADNKPTGENLNQYQINRGDMVSNTGGSVDVGAGAFEGLTTDDGTYEWVIESFHGSGPASMVIKVQM